MQGQDRLSGDGPIPDADVFRNRVRTASASSASISTSSLGASDAARPERHQQQGERRSSKLHRHSDRRGAHGKAKEEEEKKEKIDKTYRLFVVAVI